MQHIIRAKHNGGDPQSSWFSRHRVLFLMQLFILLLLGLILYSIYTPNKSGFVAKTITKTIEKVVPGVDKEQNNFSVVLTLFAIIGIISMLLVVWSGYRKRSQLKEFLKNRNMKIEIKRGMDTEYLPYIDDIDDVFDYMDREALDTIIQTLTQRPEELDDDTKEHLAKYFETEYQLAKQLKSMTSEDLRKINEELEAFKQYQNVWMEEYGKDINFG